MKTKTNSPLKIYRKYKVYMSDESYSKTSEERGTFYHIGSDDNYINFISFAQKIPCQIWGMTCMMI